MRVVSWNLNGIRAAIRKGLDDWIEEIDADIWLLQEVRALPEQLPKDWKLPSGHEVVWHPAEKKGYSGVASFSRIGMEEIARGIDTKLDPDDSEGRVLVTKCGSLTCINIYLPNGGSGPARQAYKDQWLEDLLVWAKQYLASPEPVVLVGDLKTHRVGPLGVPVQVHHRQPGHTGRNRAAGNKLPASSRGRVDLDRCLPQDHHFEFVIEGEVHQDNIKGIRDIR